MARFALAHRDAFAFIEFHHHGSYLDAESQRLDQGLRRFGAGFVELAQRAGVLKPIDSTVLMELVFGGFNALIRAGFENRVDLSDEVLAAAEAACWDAVSVHPAPA